MKVYYETDECSHDMTRIEVHVHDDATTRAKFIYPTGKTEIIEMNNCFDIIKKKGCKTLDVFQLHTFMKILVDLNILGQTSQVIEGRTL